MKSGHDSRADGGEFLDALTAINLRRIWIITLAGCALGGCVFAINFFLVGWVKVTQVAATDFGSSFLIIFIIALIRRRPRGRWLRGFIICFALLWLAEMDVYYFSAFGAGTHNASYAIGVVGLAVFFVLPPVVFLPALLLNHACYCAILLTWSGRKVAAPLMDGTVSVALAGLASWLLYNAVRENFRQERIITERNRALGETNAELREVMAIAAHDLRSPLLGLRDLLGLARREPADGGRLARVLELATDSCSGMVRLVSRLVEAHATETAAEKLRLVPHDLRAGCTTSIERLRATAETKQQRLALTLPAEAAMGLVDDATLGQVIENLLGNALKFSPRESAVEVALMDAGGVWQIEVRDEGPGVPAEERADLFRKFHRGTARPTGNEASTGLGLHIVKTLTEAMDGRVSHTPREPRGSVFRVELPRA